MTNIIGLSFRLFECIRYTKNMKNNQLLKPVEIGGLNCNLSTHAILPGNYITNYMDVSNPCRHQSQQLLHIHYDSWSQAEQWVKWP